MQPAASFLAGQDKLIVATNGGPLARLIQKRFHFSESEFADRCISFLNATNNKPTPMNQKMPEITGPVAGFTAAVQIPSTPKLASRGHPTPHCNPARNKPSVKKLGLLALCAFVIFLVVKVTLDSTALLNFLNTAMNTPHYQNMMK